MKSIFFRIVSNLILISVLSACSGQVTELPPTEVFVFFTADRTSIQAGECTVLHWEVGIIEDFSVTINGDEVPKVGETEVCPAETRIYELAVDMGTHFEIRDIEISVSSPSEQPENSEPATPGIPAYQASSWVVTSGPPGGLGYDIRMRPDNPDIMFVTDAHAGIHKSTDGGLTWFPSNTGILPGANNDVPIFCATIDPHNYDVIWAGTQLIGHVYRSSDNGASWVEMDNGITKQGRSLRGITIDPNNPNVIYAAGEVDAMSWASEMHLEDIGGYGGEVYKSTDGGQSWRRIWSGDNIARYIWVDPRNSNRVYVTTGIFDRAPANKTPDDRGGVGILRSDDGGESWVVLNENNGLSGLIIPSLFMHPENPDILIAAVSNFGIGGVFITYNGGDTWTRAGSGPTSSDAVEIAMSNPDIWYSATEGTIARSDDAGHTWETFKLATQDRNAGMPIDLQVDPRDPYRIFDNNYGGGNFLSEDGGQTWVDASAGYSGATIGGMLVLPGDGHTLLVGANTGGFISFDAGKIWLGTELPSATQIILHPDGLIAADSGGGIWHSPDDGMTWTRTQVVDLLAEMAAGRIYNDVASMRAFAMAPSDPNILYVGFHNAVCLDGIAAFCLDPMPNIYRSNDGGYTWQELPGTPFERKAVLSIAVHPVNSQELYAATVMGLFYSSNGGDGWTKVESFDLATRQVSITDTDNLMVTLDLWVVTDVVFDPFDSQVIFAATQHGGVWRSSDGGQTWSQAAAGMDPNEIVAKLLPDPNYPNLLYAATISSGVYVTLDGGQSWQSINTGLAPRNIVNLALSEDSSILYAGAGSRGVWRLSTVEQP
jgi:photosystem II stability/assembly factor-like uncharacterized protein